MSVQYWSWTTETSASRALFRDGCWMNFCWMLSQASTSSAIGYWCGLQTVATTWTCSTCVLWTATSWSWQDQWRPTAQSRAPSGTMRQPRWWFIQHFNRSGGQWWGKDSSTWVDFKLKIEGQLLLHLELRGFRSDHDMTVQLNYINDALVMNLHEEPFVRACVVTIFSGWWVVAASFEVGGRLYVCSDHGTIVSLDYPLCHFEIRMTAISSLDSVSMDADRLEFRFRAAADQIDVACSQITVPSTWLVVSRVSGPVLIENAKSWCRSRAARIEVCRCLNWPAYMLTGQRRQRLSRWRRWALGSGQLVWRPTPATSTWHARLLCWALRKRWCPKKRLLYSFMIRRRGRWRSWCRRSLGGRRPSQQAQPLGRASQCSDWGSLAVGDKTLHVQRPFLETRLNESMAEAAVTPQAFVSQVHSVKSGMAFLGPEGSTRSVPRSYMVRHRSSRQWMRPPGSKTVD